ncbi:MAG: DUF5916 domain-containing protein [Vicinamibacterales bacterium]
MRRLSLAAAGALLTFCIANPVLAQSKPGPTDPKVLRALTVRGGIRVDGTLTEPDWKTAQVITDFVQQEPSVGQPVSERTEVRVLVDDANLYVGVVCFDATPGGIIAREMRRDNPLANDDRFEMVLDTFHDHRNAFHFVINPLGTQYDALITDEGQDVNLEWDERWWSSVTRTATGWTAEIRIPFTTLRTREGTDTFGINFKRFIRRKNETAQWTGWDRDFTFLTVSQAGHLLGVESIHAGLKLRVKPYALGGFQDKVPGGTASVDAQHRVGLETLKVSLTPGLTAELTANTDFAQAEVDEAQVNLTRFPLFFPEKREFFLERAGIFEFGLGGRRGGDTERNLQMFFSRRIGLTADRRPVPVIGGAKVTGRAAGFDIGLLNVQTDRFEGRPGSNYTVFRGKRNILARSNIGLFASNRQSSGGDYNRVIGADANFTLFKNTDVQGFIGRSITPGRKGDDMVGRVKYNWYTDIYEVFVEHLYVGKDFQHDVGFVRRTDVERTDTAFIWEPRPKKYNIRNFVFRGEVTYLTDTRRRLLTREQIFQMTTRFQNDDTFRVNTTATFDRLDRPFEIATGIKVPPGDYHFATTFAEGETSGKRPVGVKLRVGAGTLYGGDRNFVRVTPAWRPSSLVSFESDYEWNDVTLPQGAFTTHVVNARMNLNLSNRWLTTSVAQYDSASKRNNVFVRLNYIYRPGDDLFVVYNQSHVRGALQSDPDRSLTIKMTHSFDFR